MKNKIKIKIRHLSLEDHSSRYQMMEECLNPLENSWWSYRSLMDAHGQGSPWR